MALTALWHICFSDLKDHNSQCMHLRWGDKPQAGGQETWLEHGIGMSGSRKEMHGIFLHERLTQRAKNDIQNVGLRQCATTTISTHAQAMYTNAL